MKAFFQLRQFLGNDLLYTGVLQTDRVNHSCGTFRDTGRGVAKAWLPCCSLKREGAENIDIVKLCKFIAVAEGTAGRNDGVIQRDAAECHLCVYHIISSFTRTGPSLQMRLLPYFVLQEQPMQAPKPQPIRSSKLS